MTEATGDERDPAKQCRRFRHLTETTASALPLASSRVLVRVELNDLLGRVELSDLLDRLDINQLLERVDIDRVLDRADMDKLMARIDINQALDRVDIDKLMPRVDILWVVLAFWGWEFIYYAYFWTTSGKTPGMTLLGVRVVRHDGSDVGTRRGLVRTLVFPLSFLLLGLGFLGILFGRDRRALHDTIAGTAVIYAWDARAARLRSLAREGRGRQSKRDRHAEFG